jgi:protein PET117
MRERAAKATLLGAIILSTFTIWSVHSQQVQEHEVGLNIFIQFSIVHIFVCTSQNMYKGVLRDDERRREKMRQREEELQASKQKRELYERVQNVEQRGS